jgi:hypothetical protein
MEDAKPIVGLFLDRDSLEFIIGELPHGDGFTHNLEALLKECDDDA